MDQLNAAMLSRRAFCAGLASAGSVSMTTASMASGSNVQTGAQRLADDRFSPIAGKRIALVTNQTGRVGNAHLADLISASRDVQLASILAPEHGFRGAVEAGKKVGDETDPATGARIHSLYGATRKPTPAMLRGADVVVFDIQDVGVRFYTYISTMGLAMQAAAEARLPFVVLDRPNPLGGDDVAGFVLNPAYRSFVGQYAIPIVHGMTVGELARMIKGERLLDGLDALDLRVVEASGWRRAARWPATGLPWVPTSPNIPTFDTALVYPGIGMVGELTVNEGRGTPTPFQLFGAPWLDGERLASELDALNLAGLRFEPQAYVPRAIPGVAATPRHVGRSIVGIRVVVTEAQSVRPLELGIHAMARIVAAARRQGVAPIYGSEKMFHAIAGTRRLRVMLDEGTRSNDIIRAWQPEVQAFRSRRRPYLIYA